MGRRPNGQGQGESKTSPRRINTALRRGQALRMRQDGAKFRDIRDALGYSSVGAAAQDVQRALAETVAEPAAEVRAMELLRLDELWCTAMAVLRAHHVTVSNGRVVVDPDTGEKITDTGPVLAAIDRLLRIQERRAKLLGLDAPAKVEVISDDVIDAEIRRLADELDRSAAAQVAAVEGPEG